MEPVLNVTNKDTFIKEKIENNYLLISYHLIIESYLCLLDLKPVIMSLCSSVCLQREMSIPYYSSCSEPIAEYSSKINATFLTKTLKMRKFLLNNSAKKSKFITNHEKIKILNIFQRIKVPISELWALTSMTQNKRNHNRAMFSTSCTFPK